MKKLLIAFAFIFTLTFGFTSKNTVSAYAGCMDVTLSCGKSGELCYGKNVTIEEIVDFVMEVDALEC